MSKRSHDGPHGHSPKRRKGEDDSAARAYKRHQQAYEQRREETMQKPQSNSNSSTPARPDAPRRNAAPKHISTSTNEELPPATSKSATITAYTPFKVRGDLPPLPAVSSRWADAPFRHKSSFGYDRTASTDDMTYEKLEFLGDAYIEVFASRLIFEHFPTLTAGNQSQVRELLVKNETLAEYARAYNFEQRLNLSDLVAQAEAAKNRGNKGLNKILGDTFEAYVAAVIQSDPEHGFVIAEKWLTALWTPKLLEHVRKHFSLTASIAADEGVDMLVNYDPTAKATLQRQLLSAGVKLEYEKYREPEELKGDQLGQNRHYIALYLTGYGYDRKPLGKGEGKNKVEAGNWAAIRAMHGESKTIVDECAAQLAESRGARKKEQAAQEAVLQT